MKILAQIVVGICICIGIVMSILIYSIGYEVIGYIMLLWSCTYIPLLVWTWKSNLAFLVLFIYYLSSFMFLYYHLDMSHRNLEIIHIAFLGTTFLAYAFGYIGKSSIAKNSTNENQPRDQ